MRHEAGHITCDGCSIDITTVHLCCDRLDGEWCRECFGECPCPPGTGPCEGEGCPTLCVELTGEYAAPAADREPA